MIHFFKRPATWRFQVSARGTYYSGAVRKKFFKQFLDLPGRIFGKGEFQPPCAYFESNRETFISVDEPDAPHRVPGRHFSECAPPAARFAHYTAV
jgi:hypothetical protein